MKKYDFTFNTYRTMLEKFKLSGYQFTFFPNAKKLLQQSSSFILLRHDVDLSLESALEIAEIESELDVKSTFFFILRSSFYNLFSQKGSRIVEKIIKQGHHIGLHFDCAAYPENTEVAEFSSHCAREVSILNGWFGISIEIVSYHRPKKIILSGDPNLSFPLPHTYMKLFTKEIKYISDSRCKWRFGHPLDSKEYKIKKPMQILTHPIWWNHEDLEGIDTLEKFLNKKETDNFNLLVENSTIFPRNIH